MYDGITQLGILFLRMVLLGRENLEFPCAFRIISCTVGTHLHRRLLNCYTVIFRVSEVGREISFFPSC